MRLGRINWRSTLLAIAANIAVVTNHVIAIVADVAVIDSEIHAVAGDIPTICANVVDIMVGAIYTYITHIPADVAVVVPDIAPVVTDGTPVLANVSPILPHVLAYRTLVYVQSAPGIGRRGAPRRCLRAG